MTLPSGALHPDFEAAPAHQQYRADPARLCADLNVAAKAGGGSWARAVLPDGLQVALRVLPNGARQAAIGRDARDYDHGAWTAELNTWRRRFGATDWSVEHGETKAGGPAVSMTERLIVQDFFGSNDDEA